MTLGFSEADFFASVRSKPFGGRLSAEQVDGMKTLLAEGLRRQTPKTHLAYILATAFHETAKTMQPIAEYGKGRGRAYGARDPQTGEAYYGRGYVQLTWKTNYERAKNKLGEDFVFRPELAMRPDLAAKILFSGMSEGWFTGKALADYDRPAPAEFDPVGARRIVNGRNADRYRRGLDRDADHDRTIAGYYDAFLEALSAAFSGPDAVSAASPAKPESLPELSDHWLVRLLRWVFR